jgi:hypothetical protein
MVLRIWKHICIGVVFIWFSLGASQYLNNVTYISLCIFNRNIYVYTLCRCIYIYIYIDIDIPTLFTDLLCTPYKDSLYRLLIRTPYKDSL